MLDLHMRPGEKLGFVGRSGAGKSTIVALLLRSCDVEGCRILIDGQDRARDAEQPARADRHGHAGHFRSCIARFATTIVYGRPDATEEAMLAAARRGEAFIFIGGRTDPKARKGYGANSSRP